VPLGLAAEEVTAFRPAGEGLATELAAVLGISRATGDAAAYKSLYLEAGGRGATVNVEGPVRIRSVAAGQLLPTPRLLAQARLAPVIGFLEEDGRVVLLLDVASVVECAARMMQAAKAAAEGAI
jgi:hypothetical protein